MALLAVVLPLVTSCRRGDVNQNVNITVASDAADGLDLKAVTALLKEVETPEKLEERINSGSPRICNLDLNEDGKVDYVKVQEYEKDGVKGFSLSAELGPDDVQELATIEIQKDASGNTRVQTHGNSHVYGNNHYYHYRGPGIGDYLLMHYLFSSHRHYHSPYGHNRYPSSFARSSTVDRASYRSGLQSVDSKNVSSAKKPQFRSSNASPNKNRTSSKIKAPLRNPTKSQRAFQKRNPSRTVRSGGFGSRSKGSSSGSFRSSSRSGSSFGGGK